MSITHTGLSYDEEEKISLVLELTASLLPLLSKRINDQRDTRAKRLFAISSGEGERS